MGQTNLLCTFSEKNEVDATIEAIYDTYKLVYNYIYILENKSNPDELYITYNIDNEYKPQIPLRNTILVHRKKETNTLYTINALNNLVREENNGVMDKNFVIDWEKYRNSIIVTNSAGSKKINTRVYEIIEINNETE